MILDKIAESTKERVIEQKLRVPLVEMISLANHIGQEGLHGRGAFAFEKALKRNDLSLICEVKKASPSKGIIHEAFPYLDIALQYQKAGASAISVLTEPTYFQGSDKYLTAISKQVTIPVLRKDFIIDEYQIYESKLMGADAILLIGALLSEEDLKRYLKLSSEMGMSSLVEAHNEDEVEKAIKAGAGIIGVNNRDLRTFEVDIHNCIRLRSMVPSNITFVAESGITGSDDIRLLKENNINTVLVGEALMKSKDIEKQMRTWRLL